MDKEIRDKYYRIVGELQGLEKTAQHVGCMPEDNVTSALLVAIRGLIQQAVTSAWYYANTRTADSESEAQK